MAIVVPYFGRAEILTSSSSIVQDLIKDASLLLGEISKVAVSDKEWKNLKDELHEVIQKIISNEIQCECYKVNIMRNALFPYIRQMHSRLILNRRRFQQIQLLLRILCTPTTKDDHPANILGEIETIVTSIDSEGGWFKSEFASKMRHAVTLEWSPIITDNRKGLQNVASKLLFVGLVDLFRSSLFILPILTLLAEIALIIQNVNNKSGFSPENIVQLVKSSFLIILAAISVRLVGMLPGLGYSASMLSVVIFIVSSIDPLLKLACPFVAPNMAKISFFLDRMETLENQLSRQVQSTISQFQPTITSSVNNIIPDNPIEEVPMDSNLSDGRSDPDQTPNTSSYTSSSVPIEVSGLRRRKI